jgi:hypothetical protein
VQCVQKQRGREEMRPSIVRSVLPREVLVSQSVSGYIGRCLSGWIGRDQAYNAVVMHGPDPDTRRGYPFFCIISQWALYSGQTRI